MKKGFYLLMVGFFMTVIQASTGKAQDDIPTNTCMEIPEGPERDACNSAFSESLEQLKAKLAKLEQKLEGAMKADASVGPLSMRRVELEKQIADLRIENANYQDLKTKGRAVRKRLLAARVAKSRVASLNSQLASLNSQITSLNLQVASKESKLSNAEQEASQFGTLELESNQIDIDLRKGRRAVARLSSNEMRLSQINDELKEAKNQALEIGPLQDMISSVRNKMLAASRKP